MPAPRARQEADSEIKLAFVQRGQCRIPVQAAQAQCRLSGKVGKHA